MFASSPLRADARTSQNYPNNRCRVLPNIRAALYSHVLEAFEYVGAVLSAEKYRIARKMKGLHFHG